MAKTTLALTRMTILAFTARILAASSSSSGKEIGDGAWSLLLAAPERRGQKNQDRKELQAAE